MANQYARNLRKNLTPQEVKLWRRLRELRQRGHRFRRQAPIKNYIIDFICFNSKIAVEIDGGQHAGSEAAVKDAERDNFLRGEGFVVLRFWNSEIDSNLDGVLEHIAAHL